METARNPHTSIVAATIKGMVCVLLLSLNDADAWMPCRRHPTSQRSIRSVSIASQQRGASTQLRAKGFGAAGSSSKPTKTPKIKKSSIKKAQQRIADKYGDNIAKGTQGIINEAMADLPPHLHVATQLYQRLQKWDAYYDKLPVLQQSRIPQQDVDGANRARQEFEDLCREHNLTTNDIHNIFQRITWDASADAKAVRSMTGTMSETIRNALDEVASKVVTKSCLDVGCGYGVLVPYLRNAGVQPGQLVGIDLSSEMIKNAREQHRGIEFRVADFLDDSFEERYDSIVFCATLHDLPDPIVALQKAARLVHDNGVVIVSHPQGAGHVLGQVQQNPVMVQRGLPDAKELHDLALPGMTLEVEPTTQSDKPYLAVFKKSA